MQGEFLDSPIQEFGDEEGVFRGARDFMHPAKLAQLLAPFSKHSEDISVQVQLIDASGVRIGSIEHLFRPRGDADGPRRAGLGPFLQKVALVVENLDAGATRHAIRGGNGFGVVLTKLIRRNAVASVRPRRGHSGDGGRHSCGAIDDEAREGGLRSQEAARSALI
jgi:hypothetical protein